MHQSRSHPGTGTTTLTAQGRRDELADFLRSRRHRTSTAAVGLPDSGRRRTPGLRREEVATLAGISVDWYIRLEQGRGDRPSASVLDALTATLQLSQDERDHLYALARGERPLTPPAAGEADEGLLRVLDAFGDRPAMVLGHTWDVIAHNEAIAQLLVPFEDYPPEERNILRQTFLDERYRRLFADIDEVAAETVANFRACIARYPDDTAVRRLSAELTAASSQFAALWAKHEVREKSSGLKRIRQDGALRTYRYDTITGAISSDHRLVVYGPAGP